jgi:hypothetical protein
MNVRLIRYALLSAAVLISTAGFMTARKPPAPGCKLATLNGTYGFHRAGYTVIGTPPSSFTPLGGVGFIVFDGAGATVSHEATNKDGTLKTTGWTFDPLSAPAHPGGYRVNPDCTFQLVDPSTNPLTVISNGVIVGDEIFMLSTGSPSTGSSVVTVVGKRMDNSH